MKLISSIIIIVSKKTLFGIPINNSDTVNFDSNHNKKLISRYKLFIMIRIEIDCIAIINRDTEKSLFGNYYNN